MGLHPSHSNMPSVHQLPDLVEKQIRAEVDAGRLLGPLPPYLACMVQTSSIGLILKPHQQDKWRLIVNLSSPAGASVNDAIASDSCHMQYTSVLEAARLILGGGGGGGGAHSWQNWTCKMHTAWCLSTLTTIHSSAYAGAKRCI